MEVVKNKFGQVGHEDKNIYAKINAQFYVLPNLCDQLWKMNQDKSRLDAQMQLGGQYRNTDERGGEPDLVCQYLGWRQKKTCKTSTAVVPNLFDTRDQFCGRQCFHGPGWRGDFGVIQVYYIQAHLLLCGLVPDRPGLVPAHGLEVGDLCSAGLGELFFVSSLSLGFTFFLCF